MISTCLRGTSRNKNPMNDAFVYRWEVYWEGGGTFSIKKYTFWEFSYPSLCTLYLLG